MLHTSGGGDGVRFDEGSYTFGEGIKGFTSVVDVSGELKSSAMVIWLSKQADSYSCTCFSHNRDGWNIHGRCRVTVEATAQIVVALFFWQCRLQCRAQRLWILWSWWCTMNIMAVEASTSMSYYALRSIETHITLNLYWFVKTNTDTLKIHTLSLKTQRWFLWQTTKCSNKESLTSSSWGSKMVSLVAAAI